MHRKLFLKKFIRHNDVKSPEVYPQVERSEKFVRCRTEIVPLLILLKLT